jgi:hypothetical protein
VDRTELTRRQAIDRSNAFELGFLKAAQAAGLDKAGYEKMRKTAAVSMRIPDSDGGTGGPVLGGDGFEEWQRDNVTQAERDAMDTPDVPPKPEILSQWEKPEEAPLPPEPVPNRTAGDVSERPGTNIPIRVPEGRVPTPESLAGKIGLPNSWTTGSNIGDAAIGAGVAGLGAYGIYKLYKMLKEGADADVAVAALTAADAAAGAITGKKLSDRLSEKKGKKKGEKKTASAVMTGALKAAASHTNFVGDYDNRVLKVKKPKGLRASDITDTEGVGGGAVDYLLSGSAFASRRSGRASALADALNQDPGMLVEHPHTSNTLAMLGGVGLGAAIGTGVGHAINPNRSTGSGALIGGGVGGAAALLAAIYFRRKRSQELAKQFDETENLEVRNPDINRFGGLFGGSTHQSGRMEGLEKVLGTRAKDDDQGLGVDIARTAVPIAVAGTMLNSDGKDTGTADALGAANAVGQLGLNAYQTQTAKERERKLFGRE